VEIGKTTREEFDALWESHGEELTREWIEAHPGTRPFGWWLARGEERPVVAEGPVARSAKFAHTFGFFHEEAGFNRHGVQEPQASYLRRHGLLSAAEIRALASRPAVTEEDD
jgi:hypothetical protein